MSKLFSLTKSRRLLINIPWSWGYYGWLCRAGVIRSIFLFDPMELCMVLDLSGKTMKRHTEFPWTSSVAWHLASNSKGLICMVCSFELDQKDLMQRAPTVVLLISVKFWKTFWGIYSTLKSPFIVWIPSPTVPSLNWEGICQKMWSLEAKPASKFPSIFLLVFKF